MKRASKPRTSGQQRNRLTSDENSASMAIKTALEAIHSASDATHSASDAKHSAFNAIHSAYDATHSASNAKRCGQGTLSMKASDGEWEVLGLKFNQLDDY